jgi:hypothetical protein
MLVPAYYTVLAFGIVVNTHFGVRRYFIVERDPQGKPPSVPRPIVLPSLKSGLVLVVLAAMVAFGFGRLRQVPANPPLDTETRTAEVEQIISAPIDQDLLNGLLSMTALDSELDPKLSSGSAPPPKRPLPARRSRSPRRGGSHSPMPLWLLRSAFRPEIQLPVPADARSATSGKPVAVFAVLRN